LKGWGITMAEVEGMEKLPEGWTLKPLESLIRDIGDGGTPSRNDPNNFGGSIPWVVIDDIRQHIEKTKETITKKGLCSSSARLWPAGSIIISTGATIGEVGITEIPLATKQGITGIVLDDRIVFNKFFMYQLEYNKNFLIRFSQGTSFREIRPPTLVKLRIPLPPLPEQRKIAEILETVDETIEKTDAIIEKYKRIKQGLMQDLITRGITAFEFEKDKLIAAVKKALNDGDHEIGREENLVNHLSRHLDDFFPKWDIDSEVEKNNERQRPDIIVHKRETNNNLFAIEVKKNDNLNAIKEDIKKLENVMLGNYHYEDAIFIGFNIENFREIFKLSNRINYILVSQNGKTMVKPRIRKFKDSPLGNIPEEWKVAKLGEMATILLSNVDKKIFSQEIKVKLCNYLEVYKHDYIFKNINFSIGSVNIREYQKFRVDKGDVIITKDSEEFDDIAKSAYVEDEIEDLICGYHLCLIKPKINITAGQYLAMVLWFEKYNKQFQNKANGITRFGISKETIESALLPLPSLPEQQRIALILSQMDEAIEEEQNYKEKLERIKQGLMEDLLTGEVRTNHLIKEGVESV